MKKTMIFILILTALSSVLASDPDSGKVFITNHPYLTNVTTGEHYLHTDTIELELNETIRVVPYKMNENGEWVPANNPEDTYIFKTLPSSTTSLDNYWNTPRNYIKVEGSIDHHLTLVKKFDGIRRIIRGHIGHNGLSVTASAYIKVKPETDPDTSGTTPGGDPIYSSDEIAICSYFSPNEPLDTLVLEPGKSVMLTLRAYSQNGLTNTICDNWEIDYCNSKYTLYVPYPEIECSEQGIGYITATSGNEKTTLVLVFQDPVSIKTVKKAHYSKKQKRNFLSEVNGRRVRGKHKACGIIISKNRKIFNTR